MVTSSPIQRESCFEDCQVIKLPLLGSVSMSIGMIHSVLLPCVDCGFPVLHGVFSDSPSVGLVVVKESVRINIIASMCAVGCHLIKCRMIEVSTWGVSATRF